MEELTGRGLVVINALQEFRGRHAAGESLYGVVDQHLSAGGHQALADLVTPVAAELLEGECRSCLDSEEHPRAGSDPAGR
jgi:hypothetical protein